MAKGKKLQPLPPRRKRLSGKLIITFALVSIFCSTVHLTAFMTMRWVFYDRLLQTANWEIAENYALELQAFTSPTFNQSKVEEVIFKLSQLNPTFDIHLLDEEAKPVFSAPVTCDVPSLNDIQAFLETDGFPLTPIYGPRLSECKHAAAWSPFSAARMTIEGKPGYVYVVLRGGRYSEIFHAVGDFGLVAVSIMYIIGLSVMTVVLGVILLLFFTKRFQKLTEVVGQFSEGDYEIRVNDDTDDELGLHARAFNQMAQTIQDNIAKLEESDDLRRQLVANVSHDLRSPIGAMHILLETLHSELILAGDKKQLKFVDRALLNCQELRVLVGDLFELSKLDAKEKCLAPKSVAVVKILRDIVNKFLSSADEKDMAIILDCPRDLPNALVEERLFVRAVSNLVENAIRYSSEGGELRIAAKQVSASEIALSVSDKGDGIPSEELPQLFDRYFRGQRTSEREKTGSGLGLAIVKQIVELHGSTISVESTLGEGSTFSFNVPVA